MFVHLCSLHLCLWACFCVYAAWSHCTSQCWIDDLFQGLRGSFILENKAFKYVLHSSLFMQWRARSKPEYTTKAVRVHSNIWWARGEQCCRSTDNKWHELQQSVEFINGLHWWHPAVAFWLVFLSDMSVTTNHLNANTLIHYGPLLFKNLRADPHHPCLVLLNFLTCGLWRRRRPTGSTTTVVYASQIFLGFYAFNLISEVRAFPSKKISVSRNLLVI